MQLSNQMAQFTSAGPRYHPRCSSGTTKRPPLLLRRTSTLVRGNRWPFREGDFLDPTPNPPPPPPSRRGGNQQQQQQGQSASQSNRQQQQQQQRPPVPPPPPPPRGGRTPQQQQQQDDLTGLLGNLQDNPKWRWPTVDGGRGARDSEQRMRQREARMSPEERAGWDAQQAAQRRYPWPFVGGAFKPTPTDEFREQVRLVLGGGGGWVVRLVGWLVG